jgi:hypothetical protein
MRIFHTLLLAGLLAACYGESPGPRTGALKVFADSVARDVTSLACSNSTNCFGYSPYGMLFYNGPDRGDVEVVGRLWSVRGSGAVHVADSLARTFTRNYGDATPCPNVHEGPQFESRVWHAPEHNIMLVWDFVTTDTATYLRLYRMLPNQPCTRVMGPIPLG